MILSDLAIRRPVLATVANLLILLLGLIAWDRLTIREYPDIDDPAADGADVVDAFDTGDGIFERCCRVARARSLLQRESEDPIVAKTESDASPIIYMAISSDRHDEMELTDYADRIVKDRLQVLPGVAQLIIMGERRYSMRIWLDRARLAAYELTPADVEAALRAQNVEVPSGRIESTDREFTVLSEADLRTPEQFEEIILKDAGGYLVRLGEVARAEIGAEEVRNMSRASGRRAIAIARRWPQGRTPKLASLQKDEDATSPVPAVA